MNAPNPLIPQGSLEERRTRNKSNVYIAVFAILAFHVVLLGALLLQGCKDRQTTMAGNNQLPPPPPISSNTPLVPNDNIGWQNPLVPPSNNVIIPPPVVVPPSTTPDNVVVPPATTPAATEHTVASGESFYVIGKKYNLSSADIAKANPGVDSRRLKVGQKIKLPERTAAATVVGPVVAPVEATAPGEELYVVKAGDSLIKIAKNQRSSVKQIKMANNLKTDMVRVGQKLKIPAKAPAGGATTSPPVPATSTSYVTPLPGRSTASL